MRMPKIDFTEEVNLNNDFNGILKHKKLHLVGLSNVQNLDEVEKFSLCRKQQLDSLILNCYYLNTDEVADTATYNIVLEKLIPPRTLEHLQLLGYKGVTFPEWMLNLTSIMPNLVHLELSSLAMCDHLPPLGQLPKLQSLVLEDIPNVKNVGEVFAGGSRPFVKLRDLNIRGMRNLERWLTTLPTIDEEELVYMFPNLHHLKVSHCPKVRFEPSLPLCLLLEVDACDEILLGQPDTPSQSHPMPTRRIIIQSCELWSSGGTQLRFLISLSSLKFLSINLCEGLSTWGESVGALTCLEELELSLCDVPACLGSITSLQSLKIYSCHVPCDFPQHLLQLSCLQELQMSCCAAEFEVSAETARSILAHIPDINICSVACIGYIEQKNGILSICQTAPLSQDSSGDARKVVLVGNFQLKSRLRIKRLLRVLKLGRHKCRLRVASIRTNVRRGENASTSCRQAHDYGQVYVGDFIDFMRRDNTSQEMRMSTHHRRMEVRAGVSQMNLY